MISTLVPGGLHNVKVTKGVNCAGTPGKGVTATLPTAECTLAAEADGLGAPLRRVDGETTFGDIAIPRPRWFTGEAERQAPQGCWEPPRCDAVPGGKPGSREEVDFTVTVVGGEGAGVGQKRICGVFAVLGDIPLWQAEEGTGAAGAAAVVATNREPAEPADDELQTVAAVPTGSATRRTSLVGDESRGVVAP